MLLELSATAINRNFAGKVGIKTDSIISFTGADSTDPVYNRVTGISILMVKL